MPAQTSSARALSTATAALIRSHDALAVFDAWVVNVIASSPSTSRRRKNRDLALAKFVRPAGRLGRHAATVLLCNKYFFRGFAVSFQITILKVLAGHPEGPASLAELGRAVGILIF